MEPAIPTPVEKEKVNDVYDRIAPHFSATRYKPWPLVDKFLREIPVGSLVADVGCGNGKYMGVNPGALFIGCDRSTNLTAICGQKGFEALVADNLRLPYASGRFRLILSTYPTGSKMCSLAECRLDFAISIAVLHHFSTEANRLWALRELHRIVKVGGQVVMTVWAFEQEKKKYDTQDVMIPWHLKPQFQLKPKLSKEDKLPKKGSKKSQRAAEEIEKSQALVKTLPADSPAQPTAVKELSEGTFEVYERYYHLFKKGELEELIMRIPGFEVVSGTWDADNWYVIARKTA